MLDTSTWLCGPPVSTGQKQQFPARFEYNLQRTYLIDDPKTLVLFSGACSWGETTDIRPETGATYVCPYDELPNGIGPYDVVLADPPYNAGFAKEWEADLPRPKRIARSACSVLRVGGLFLLLHIIVLPAYKDLGLKRVALHPVLCGPNNAIRVLNVLRYTGKRTTQ